MGAFKTRTIEVIEYRVVVRAAHIEEGKCRDPNRCMEKLANLEALEGMYGEGKIERLRIDGAQIKFNFAGYRWAATTPKSAKVNLIDFDRKKPVRPHTYMVTAVRGTKIMKNSPERQAQINKAREQRRNLGRPDAKYNRQTIHQRVVGLGAV